MANTTLSGTIKRTIRAPDRAHNGWCVFTIQPWAGQDLPQDLLDNTSRGRLKCSGRLPELAVGDHYSLTGYMAHHPRFGAEFRFQDAQPATLHEDTSSLTNYLSELAPELLFTRLNPLVASMTPRGVIDALDAQDTERLVHARLPRADANKLITHWHRAQHSSDLRAACAQLGLPDDSYKAIEAFFQQQGLTDQGSDIVRRNPFVLSAILGHPYPLLVRAAHGQPNGTVLSERIDSAIGHILMRLGEAGHTCNSEQNLIQSLRQQDEAFALRPPTTPRIKDRISTLAQRNVVSVRGPEHNRFVALSEMARAEIGIARHMARLYEANRVSRPDVRSAQAAVEADGRELTAKQQRALTVGAQNKVFLLTGNPGTGKTTLAKYLLSGFPDRSRALLLAPTGKAAAQLSESVGKRAYTIAAALNYLDGPNDRLDADVVLVDELSMVSIHDGVQLLQALPDKSNLILSGDPEQLPPIGPGNILRDLTQSWVPHIHLDEVQRQNEASDILRVASDIRAGTVPFATGPKYGDALHMSVDPSDAGNLTTRIHQIVSQLVNRGVPPQTIQVLLPTRVNQQGCQVVNELLRPLLNVDSANGGPSVNIADNIAARVGDRVRHLENDYPRGVHNGMVGYVTRINTAYRSLEVDYNGFRVAYDADQAASQLDLTYAATVHSAQGSEYPVVVMGLGHQHSKMLTRGLLYTGITRAKSLALIASEPGMLQQALSSDPAMIRHTNLQHELACHQPQAMVNIIAPTLTASGACELIAGFDVEPDHLSDESQTPQPNNSAFQMNP